MTHLFSLVNVDPDTGKLRRSPTCGHCGNSGYVLLDQLESDQYQVAAACPACVLGMQKNLAYGEGDSSRAFWTMHDVTRFSWDGGRTIDWVCCPECSWEHRERVMIPPGRPCNGCARRSANDDPPRSGAVLQHLSGLQEATTERARRKAEAVSRGMIEAERDRQTAAVKEAYDV